MKRVLAIVLLLTFSFAANAAPRFIAVDVVIRSAQPVAAWQFELRGDENTTKVVGIESGDSAAYTRAPYYDREAINAGNASRIIVANYSLADATELPRDVFRVATIHLIVDGDDPQLDIELTTATDQQGERLVAYVELLERKGATR